MDLSKDMQILELDDFEPAFHVKPGEEDDTKRSFMTLLEEAGAQAQAGGTGYVSRAWTLAGTPLALKRLLPGAGIPKGASLTEEDVARITSGHVAAFYEEYRNQLQVSHLRGFPKLYGFGTIGASSVIVMEWVEGASLRHLMRDAARRGEGVPTSVVAEIGCSVLDVLESLARLDSTLVHRDISPANIMVRTRSASVREQAESGAFDVCLIDFGSATADGGAMADDPSFTVAMNLFRNGTPEYAPPEMLTKDIPHVDELRKSQKIDVFALCSVLYEMYCGHTPWRIAQHPDASPYRIKSENPPEALEPREPQDEPLVNAIMAGLAAEQGNRPDVSALLGALRTWLAAQGALPQALADMPGSAGAPGTVRTPVPAVARGPADGSLLAEVLPAGLYTPESTRLEVARADEGGRRASESIPAFEASGARRISRRSFLAGGLGVAAVALVGGVVAARSCKPETVYDFSNYPTATTPWAGEQFYPAMYRSNNNWVLCDETGVEQVAIGALIREPGHYVSGIMRMYDQMGMSNRYGYTTAAEQATDGTFESAWLILPRYADAGDFSTGAGGAATMRLAAVLDDSGLWGYIDQGGNMVIGPSFLEARRFSCGYAAVRTSGELWGLIDESGNVVVEPRFANLGSASEDGLVPAAESFGAPWGYVSTSGSWAIEARFAQAKRFSEGLAACMPDDGKELWGYLSPSGELAIEAQFLNARAFSDGLAPAQDAATQLWGLIDTGGRWVVQPSLLSIGEAVGDLFPAHGSPAVGYGPVAEAYDRDSATFMEYYDAVRNTPAISQGIFGCGYINRSGAWAIAPKFGDTLIRADD